MSGVFASAVLAMVVRLFVGLFVMARLFHLPCFVGRARWLVVPAAMALCGVLNWVLLPDYYAVVLEALLLTVCAVKGQGAAWRMGAFVAFFYTLATALWQYVTAAWMAVCFHSYSFLDSATLAGQAAVWAFHAALLVLAVIVWKKPIQTRREAMTLVDVVVIAGFVAVVTLSEQPYLALDADVLDQWLLLSLILMMGVLMFLMQRQMENEKELAQLRALQAESAEREYANLERTYAANAKLFHDLHNHLGVLRQLLTQGKGEEAVIYLDTLQAPLKNLSSTRWTGDDTVDYLINSKAALAESLGVCFEAAVEFPRFTTLRGADLCAILGNLLDNALEAAQQVSAGPFVRLKIRRIQQMLVIKVENSAQPPAVEDGVLRSHKAGALHGWGLKSAQTAAERYDGLVRTEYADDVFTTVVTLSFDALSSK